MNKDFYISLIARKLGNELNTAQLRDLNTWLSSSKDNAATLEDFKKVWKVSENYKREFRPDTDSAFEKFTRKYDIPKSDTATLQSFAKKKVNLSIWYILLALVALTLFTVYYFNNRVAGNRIFNENMTNMTLQLDELSELTIAPNSSFRNGKSKPIDGEILDDYASLFTILETRKSEKTINESSNEYLAIASLFEPAEKNFIIEDFSGQGFFELKSVNERQAFLGLGSGISVGTRDADFNIQNYTDEERVIIDVQNGTLVFYDGNNNAYIINAGERAAYEKKNKKLISLEKPKVNPFKWHTGVLIFNNTPLDEVFDKIEKFYGVEVIITDGSSTDNINFNTTLSMSDNLNDCLDLLHESIEMTIKRKGLRRIEISDILAK